MMPSSMLYTGNLEGRYLVPAMERWAQVAVLRRTATVTGQAAGLGWKLEVLVYRPVGVLAAGWAKCC